MAQTQEEIVARLLVAAETTSGRAAKERERAISLRDGGWTGPATLAMNSAKALKHRADALWEAYHIARGTYDD